MGAHGLAHPAGRLLWVGCGRSKAETVKQAGRSQTWKQSPLSSMEQLVPQMDFPLTVGEKWAVEERQEGAGLFLKVL